MAFPWRSMECKGRSLQQEVHHVVGAHATLDDARKIVAAVCHGSAGFLPAHRADGTWLFKDRRLTGFSNEEETMATFAGNAPWLLQDRLSPPRF